VTRAALFGRGGGADPQEAKTDRRRASGPEFSHPTMAPLPSDPFCGDDIHAPEILVAPATRRYFDS
jgi:hypothetical protein